MNSWLWIWAIQMETKNLASLPYLLSVFSSLRDIGNVGTHNKRAPNQDHVKNDVSWRCCLVQSVFYYRSESTNNQKEKCILCSSAWNSILFPEIYPVTARTSGLKVTIAKLWCFELQRCVRKFYGSKTYGLFTKDLYVESLGIRAVHQIKNLSCGKIGREKKLPVEFHLWVRIIIVWNH